MSRNLRRSICAIAILACFPGLAQAQFGPGYGEALGTLSLSASPDARVGMLDAAAFTPFDIYVVARIDHGDIGRPDLNDSNTIAAWETNTNLPPEVVVTSYAPIPFDNVSLGTFPEWLVGVRSEARIPTTEPWALARISCIFIQSPAPQDLVLDLGPATRSSFLDLGPGWVDTEYSGECFLPDTSPAKCKRLFANVYGLRINCVADCTVQTESKSWGSVKSRFGG